MAPPVICAHRGLEDLAPENTLAAFEAALERGMAIEVDIRVTADRQLVVMHDETVDRTTDGVGRVAELTLAQIQRLDASRWRGRAFASQEVPTLDQALTLARRYRDGLSPAVALDVKAMAPELIGLVCQRVAAHGMTDDVVVIGAVIESPEMRRQFHAVSPGFPCAVLAQTEDELPAALDDPWSSWVYARFVPTDEHLRAVRAAGKRMVVFPQAALPPRLVAIATPRRGQKLLVRFYLHLDRVRRTYHAHPAMVLVAWYPGKMPGCVRYGASARLTAER